MGLHRLCGYADTGDKEHVTRNDQTSVGEHAAYMSTLA